MGEITQTDFGYTFQRSLPGTGLMDYRARFYSAALGRFIQPDSIVPGAENPQAWNRYTYVSNSPINRNDPSGHWEDEGGGAPDDDDDIIDGPGGGGNDNGGSESRRNRYKDVYRKNYLSTIDLGELDGSQTAAISTPTATPRPLIPSIEYATAVSLEATIIAWRCDNGATCIGPPPPTSTPYPTPTPFLYASVSTAVAYCFGRPSGAPGCGAMYDQVAIGLAQSGKPILPPVGSIFDGAVGAYYVAKDAYSAYNDWENYVSSLTPYPTSLTPTPSATLSPTFSPMPTATPTLFFFTPTITTPFSTQTPYRIAP